MRQIKLSDLQNWSGDDDKEEILLYLLSILNCYFSISDARKEILEFNDINDELIKE
jgi:hypothetical protein